MSDLNALYFAQECTARRRAESENAGARLELAQHTERMAHLLSQHEPVGSLGLDRERLRVVFGFIKHGDLPRLEREFLALRQSQA